MGRYSPTVIAQAPTPVRSALATALDVGMSTYRDQEAERARREAFERQGQWHADEQAQQNRVHEDEVRYRQGIIDREDFDRIERMHKYGYLNGPPPDDTDDEDLAQLRAQAEAAQKQGAAPQPPATEGVAPTEQGGASPDLNVQPSSPRAANSGPGGTPSEVVPQWYVDAQANIKAQSRQLYPGSGMQRIKTPGANGQEMYAPVRRVWENQQMAVLDARLQKERDENNKNVQDMKRDEANRKAQYQQAVDVANINARALGPGARGAGAGKVPDPEAELNKDFDVESKGARASIDDMQQNKKSLLEQAKLADTNGHVDVSTAFQKQAIALDQKIQQATAREQELASPGARSKYRDQRVTKDSTDAVTELLNQPATKGGDPLYQLISPYSMVSPATREALRAEVEKQKAAIGSGLRKKYGQSSALARALNPGK